MKFISKRTSLLALVLAIICLILRYAFYYWFGCYVTQFPFFVFRTTIWLIGFLMFPVLLIAWIISMIQRKDRLWTTAMLIGLLVLTGLARIMLRPDNVIIHGLRDRILRDYSLDTLRQFARDIDQLSLPYQSPVAGDKVFIHEDLDVLKTSLKEKYPFLKVHGGPSSISEANGVVYVDWGSSFLGRWGFRVAVNGGSANPSVIEPGVTILRASDDIFFSGGND
jgi:hypothetical protein